MLQSTVHQLIVGYAREGGKYLATGSVTLVQSQGKNILVDCGDPWNGDELLQRISEHSIQKENVDVLVVTHGHIDHCGNLRLFKNAQIYMASDIAVNGEYDTISEDNPIILTTDVAIHRAPGHTDHDLIVVVRNTELGCVVVAGDVFENENDAEQWKEVSAYPEIQAKSREKILQLADWIIPGHGPLFRNDRKGSSAVHV